MAILKFILILLISFIICKVDVAAAGCDDSAVLTCLIPLVGYTNDQLKIQSLNFDSVYLEKLCRDVGGARTCMSSLACGDGSSLTIPTVKKYYVEWTQLDPPANFLCYSGKQDFLDHQTCFADSYFQAGFIRCQALTKSVQSLTPQQDLNCRSNGIQYRCMANVARDLCGDDSASYFLNVAYRFAQPLTSNCNLSLIQGPCDSAIQWCFSSVGLNTSFQNTWAANGLVTWPTSEEQLNNTCFETDWADGCTESYNCDVDSVYYQHNLAGYSQGLQSICNGTRRQTFLDNISCLSSGSISSNVGSCFVSYLSGYSNGDNCSAELVLDNCIYTYTVVCGSNTASLLVDVYRQFRKSRLIQNNCTTTLTTTATMTSSTMTATMTSSTTTATTTSSTTISNTTSKASTSRMMIPVQEILILLFMLIVLIL